MSVDENKALVRRFYEEVWGRGNTGVAFEVFADDYVRHDLRPTAGLPGPAGQKKIADDFHAAFPDLEFMVDDLLDHAAIKNLFSEEFRRQWKRRRGESG